MLNYKLFIKKIDIFSIYLTLYYYYYNIKHGHVQLFNTYEKCI